MQYGRYSVPELAELGTTVLTIKATDADDPGTGSSKVEYHISAGDPDHVFAIEVDDATGEGTVYIAQVGKLASCTDVEDKFI